MKDLFSIRRILQESAAAPDVRQWFRDHPMEREKLLVLLHQATEPQQGVQLHPRGETRSLHAENQLPVGPLLPPPGTYTFTAATPPITAPDGEPLAQLAHIPDALGAFVGAAFPPFGRPARISPNLPLPDKRIAYHIIGLVEYRGEQGEIVIETSRPSPAALAKELVLGSPVGALPDSTPLATIAGNMLRWQRGELLIDLYDMSSRMSRDRLQSLAADVVLI
jgi:hypothetical protein